MEDLFSLTAHNWQKLKRVCLTYPPHKIYKVEAVGLKTSNYTLKIKIFANMWNLGPKKKKPVACRPIATRWLSAKRLGCEECPYFTRSKTKVQNTNRPEVRLHKMDVNYCPVKLWTDHWRKLGSLSKVL